MPMQVPQINSDGVCAFIANLDEATKPVKRITKQVNTRLGYVVLMLKPIKKHAIPLIPIICKLTFLLKRAASKAQMVLLSAPIKKY